MRTGCITDPANAAGDNEYIVVVEAKSGTGARELLRRQGDGE